MDVFHIAWPFLIPIFGIIGSFTYVDRAHALAAPGRARARSPRADRDDVERGLVPPPEVDPRGF